LKKIDGIKNGLESKFFHSFLLVAGSLTLIIINGTILGIIPAFVGGGVTYLAFVTMTKSWEISSALAILFALIIFALFWKLFDFLKEKRKIFP